MRTLILLRGLAGIGKSTKIKELGLEHYTLSADALRLLLTSPEYNIHGDKLISQRSDHKVWKMLFEILEDRMSRGELTIIDATHARARSINQYKALANKYKYRVYTVEFPNDLELALSRNSKRESLKFVPEEAIEQMHSKIANQPTPTWTGIIKPEQLLDIIELKPIDYTFKYTAIVHIGDIHGCYEPIRDYFRVNPYREDFMYIFVGDLFDRGIQNGTVFKFVENMLTKPNSYIIEGNHEKHLWEWANSKTDAEANVPSAFRYSTMRSFNSCGISRKRVRMFYRKLGQLAYYTFYGYTVLVTHGGVPELPDRRIPTIDLTSGVGTHGDEMIIAETWNKKYEATKVIQIFGHRNNTDMSIENGLTYNINGNSDFGGGMRVVEIRPSYITTSYWPNHVFNQKYAPVPELTDETAIVDAMIKDKQINVSKQSIENLLALNFSRNVFKRGAWNPKTMMARGLFVDSKELKVVGRGYQKFFNHNERPETRNTALKNLTYPLYASDKYNGYLGLVFVYNDELLFASKSGIDTPHAKLFKQHCIDSGMNLANLKSQLTDLNATALFEVIDPINDPHIIESLYTKIILLDLVLNKPTFEALPFSDLIDFFKGLLTDEVRKFNEPLLQIKNDGIVINDFQELIDLINKTKRFDFEKEGYVITSSDETPFKFKLKSRYYTVWKKMRSVIHRLAKGREIKTQGYHDPEEVAILAKLMDKPRDFFWNGDNIKSVIQVRNELTK